MSTEIPNPQDSLHHSALNPQPEDQLVNENLDATNEEADASVVLDPNASLHDSDNV